MIILEHFFLKIVGRKIPFGAECSPLYGALMSRIENYRSLPKFRDSLSFLYFEHCKIEQSSSAIAAVDEKGEVHIPIAALSVLLLGPGVSITHAAVKCCADHGATILWVGEAATRLYATGTGETRSSARLLNQASLWADPRMHASVVVRMYSQRFPERLPLGLTIEQIRGREGVRVKQAYARAAAVYGVEWRGRNYDSGSWRSNDAVNRALSVAASCLYGLCHSAIVSAGYSPALGFIHSGKQLSFVYDIADLYRIDVIVPLAFAAAAEFQKSAEGQLERMVRKSCREKFTELKLLDRVVSDIDEVLSVNDDDVLAAEALFDGHAGQVGGLWDGNDAVAEGGVNYGGGDFGEDPSKS
jgi:CRISPR-associated protein Cas1